VSALERKARNVDLAPPSVFHSNSNGILGACLACSPHSQGRRQMETTHVVGIDIAKRKFDIALLNNLKVKSKVFTNDPEGFAELSQWLLRQGVAHIHACMEATGAYWEALAEYLADAGHRVSVVNPVQIAAYSKSQLQRGKTDVQDARLIARFCEREQPRLWQPTPKHQRELLHLVRQLEHLKDWQQAESNRLETASTAISQSIADSVDFLEVEIQKLKAIIKQHIDQDPTLRNNRELLKSVPGIGEGTAPWLLAYLGDGSRLGRGKQAAAFAGLCPRQWQSGSSVHGKSRISKTGHADLRRVLYMPALATYGRKQCFVPFVERLRVSGKRPMEIIVALMRKIITIAQAVLRSQLAFNPVLHAN
jgi:transposase